MQAQYAIELPLKPVDTPPDKEGIYTLREDMDTENNRVYLHNPALSKFNFELQ